MAIPTQKADLESMGYVFDNEGACRGCGERIEWWITPKGKKMPMSVQAVRRDGTDKPYDPVIRYDRIPHFDVCSKTEDFRRK
jgi:hypothetical protein